MKLIRGAAAIGVAKMAIDQARKPENQARIKGALAKVRSSRKPATSRSTMSKPSR